MVLKDGPVAGAGSVSAWSCISTDDVVIYVCTYASRCLCVTGMPVDAGMWLERAQEAQVIPDMVCSMLHVKSAIDHQHVILENVWGGRTLSWPHCATKGIYG